MPYKTIDEVENQHRKVVDTEKHKMHQYQKSLKDKNTLNLLYEHDVLTRELLLRMLKEGEALGTLTEDDKSLLIKTTSDANLFLYRLYNFGYIEK